MKWFVLALTIELVAGQQQSFTTTTASTELAYWPTTRVKIEKVCEVKDFINELISDVVASNWLRSAYSSVHQDEVNDLLRALNDTQLSHEPTPSDVRSVYHAIRRYFNYQSKREVIEQRRYELLQGVENFLQMNDVSAGIGMQLHRLINKIIRCGQMKLAEMQKLVRTYEKVFHDIEYRFYLREQQPQPQPQPQPEHQHLHVKHQKMKIKRTSTDGSNDCSSAV